CSSTPLKPGICWSVIRHDVSSRRGDCRNSSADRKVWTRSPSDVTRLFIAQRIESSSSMIQLMAPPPNSSSSIDPPRLNLKRRQILPDNKIWRVERHKYHIKVWSVGNFRWSASPPPLSCGGSPMPRELAVSPPALLRCTQDGGQT